MATQIKFGTSGWRAVMAEEFTFANVQMCIRDRVTGLDRENFNLFEGKDQQEIKTFSSEDAPVSIGVIFDMSGSMNSKIERAREAVVEFFKTANPQDEFFMITFADRPEEIADFTSSVDDIQGDVYKRQHY